MNLSFFLRLGLLIVPSSQVVGKISKLMHLHALNSAFPSLNSVCAAAVLVAVFINLNLSPGNSKFSVNISYNLYYCQGQCPHIIGKGAKKKKLKVGT